MDDVENIDPITAAVDENSTNYELYSEYDQSNIGYEKEANDKMREYFKSVEENKSFIIS